MVTRRGFLARLGSLLATAVVVPQLPAPPSVPPLMFHKDAFAIGISTAKFDPPWRLDVLYGCVREPLACHVEGA